MVLAATLRSAGAASATSIATTTASTVGMEEAASTKEAKVAATATMTAPAAAMEEAEVR